ncbi:MAG: DUF6198 family protein, partial [Lachnospiraceae bacterium]|nr:DUF6198 family protein [Lachnospiraceae bacterium]
MKKVVCYREVAYLLGIFLVAFSAALLSRADFGVSMIVAPAYLLYLKVSESVSWFTFGIAEYIVQGSLIILMMIVMRKIRFSYLLAFVTTFFYGSVLDLCMKLVSYIPADNLGIRIFLFAFGLIICGPGVALMFNTYLPQEAYDMFVVRVSERYDLNRSKFKIGYDITSTLVSVIFSFAFFGMWNFVGINIGTAISALLNGLIIGLFSKLFDKTL